MKLVGLHVQSLCHNFDFVGWSEMPHGYNMQYTSSNLILYGYVRSRLELGWTEVTV